MEEKSASFTPHHSSVQHFINDIQEGIESKLTGPVADHTEVLMMVADRCKTRNNKRWGVTLGLWETEPKPTRKHLKNCYGSIITLQETKPEEKRHPHANYLSFIY